MAGKILLVDDIEMFLQIQKAFLGNSPVEVITATNGTQALEAARARRPDLVFMDMQMPKMDGAQCCQQMKADPLLRSTPVVLITAGGRDEDRRICATAGCDEFLWKPLNRERFLDVARRFVPSVDRREKRVPTNIPAVIRVNDESVNCTLCNISARGCYVATEQQVLPKSVVDFSFRLPGGDMVKGHGRVAWSNMGDLWRQKKFPPGFGMEIALIAKETGDALRRFVQESPSP